MIEYWYVAQRPFTPATPEWPKYIEWSGLTQLKSLITLDATLCPRVPSPLNDEDWHHNVHMDSFAWCFRDLQYLEQRIAALGANRILATIRHPMHPCDELRLDARFAFAGYDILDKDADMSLLTNCGPFPEAFAPQELSSCGLLPMLSRADAVRQALEQHYPEHSHISGCQVWALWDMQSKPT
jgi:hypothetical protein